MIIDSLERAERYYSLSKYFRKAFEYVKNNDLSTFETGRYEIEGDKAYLVISEEKPNVGNNGNLEAHRKYMDVQMAVEGSFGLAWKPWENCKNVISYYDRDKDVAFYSDKPDIEVEINSNNFAILMPEDAHLPQPPKENVKKAVLKIMI